VGNGPEMERIKAKAGDNVRFMGHEPIDRLCRHMQLAKAFIFAAEEDFGIIPVEAQACGTPVIAFNRGGVTETVVDGKTGVFFNEQTSDSIIAAVERFESLTFDPRYIHQRAAQFSTKRFREEFARFVKRHWSAFETNRMQNKSSIGMDDAMHNAAQKPRLRPAEVPEIDTDDMGVNVA